jgi:hypothetical protein
MSKPSVIKLEFPVGQEINRRESIRIAISAELFVADFPWKQLLSAVSTRVGV